MQSNQSEHDWKNEATIWLVPELGSVNTTGVQRRKRAITLCYQHHARDHARNTREVCVEFFLPINSQYKVRRIKLLFTNYLHHAEYVDLEHENVT